MTVAVVGGLAAAVPGPTASPAAELWEDCAEQVTFRPDAVTVRGPRFTEGPLIVTSLAADPVSPSLLAVSNGWQAHVSDDGGCSWTRILTKRPVEPNGSALTVVARRGAATRVLAAVRAIARGTPADVHLLRMETRDGTEEAAVDLPLDMAAQQCSETARCLVRFVDRGGPGIGYATSPGLGGALPRVAATPDGGRTWAPLPPHGADPILDVAVDPEDATRVLVVAGPRLLRSEDGGRTSSAATVPAPLSPEARVVFTRSSRHDAVVVNRVAGGTTVYASTDDGVTFSPTGVVVPADGIRDVAVQVDEDDEPRVVLAAAGRLFREADDGSFDTLLKEGAGVSRVAPSAAGVWVLRSGALSFVPNPFDAAEPRAAPRWPGLDVPDVVRRPGGRLHVGERLVVPAGATTTRVVTADLARYPGGLDVFFLVDTSGSMAAKIAPMALAFGRVVDALNREGTAARFGLGEHGDSSFRYRRLADLGTPPEEVQRRMLLLTPTGGLEYHYTSFYQLATGKGMQALTGGSIPPGQHASFEPGALHLLVHATDEPDNTDPEGPTEPVALAVLREYEVRHIGIYPYDGAKRDASRDVTAQALRRYAAATEAFAPAGGLDCDGDGVVDLREGDPIACSIPGSTSADAPIATLLERLLLSVAAREEVAVAPGSSPLDARVTPLGDYRAVDLHQRNTGLRFSVDVLCPVVLQGTDVVLPLRLHVGDAVVAVAELPVSCLAPLPPPLEAPDPPAREPIPRVAAGVPPAVPNTPALAHSVAAAEAASSAASSAHAAQAGLAVAPDEAAQLAEQEEDSEMRFVAHRSRAPSPAPAAAAALAALVLALSLARVRTATALNRRRPW